MNTPKAKDNKGRPLTVVKAINASGDGGYAPPGGFKDNPKRRTETASNGTPTASRRWEPIK